jgi:hypothetical protein
MAAPNGAIDASFKSISRSSRIVGSSAMTRMVNFVLGFSAAALCCSGCNAGDNLPEKGATMLKIEPRLKRDFMLMVRPKSAWRPSVRQMVAAPNRSKCCRLSYHSGSCEHEAASRKLRTRS